MREENPSEMHESLERYLDGVMDAREREAFEREIGRDGELRAQVEAQREIDRVLIERFGARGVRPAEGEGSRSAGEDSGDLPRGLTRERAGRRGRRAGLIAAGVLLVVGVGAYVMLMPARAPFDQPGEVYARIVASGFEPREVCTDDAAFRDWMARKFDQALVIPSDSPGVELVGWDYTRVLTTRTGVLLARVEGREVIVLVERRKDALRLARASHGLRVFRRDVGGVSLYEVTPMDEARLLPLARVPGPR